MKILRETKDMTTEEFAQYKSDRAQATKAASKAMEKGNVTEAKAEETESEPEAEEKADDASTENSNTKTNPPLNLIKITDAKEQMKMITRYNEAIAMAQETVLPDRPKRTKEWYQLSLTELQKAQERTRAAFHNYMLKTTKKTKSALKAARDDEKAAFNPLRSAMHARALGLYPEVV